MKNINRIILHFTFFIFSISITLIYGCTFHETYIRSNSEIAIKDRNEIGTIMKKIYNDLCHNRKDYIESISSGTVKDSLFILDTAYKYLHIDSTQDIFPLDQYFVKNGGNTFIDSVNSRQIRRLNC